jgi:DNA-binding LytR/AlgR family response regulator
MIQCIIVDDEPLARNLLASYIAQLPDIRCVAVCQNALEAFHVLHQQEVDLIFLDIQMPGISGPGFLRSLKAPPKVIFTTAYPDHAVEAFELEAVDYLVKPITFERCIKAVQKVAARNIPAAVMPQLPDETPYVFLKVNRRLIRIDHADIIYAESSGDYLKIYTAAKTHITNMTLSKFEALLPVHRFARIHRSTLVNLSFIQYVEGNFVRIHEQELSIGLTYKESLSQKLRQYN